jgi:hypothetical protein
MKKIIASAVGLIMVGGVAVTTASAVESQFGGYWRTRTFFQDNFTQNDPYNDSAYNRTDTRTRLFYTAKFNDNFKFVNQFEFNANYGDNNGGDIGTDGNTFVVKRSYADFTLGMVNAKIGLQGAVISRGFIFDDDFAGAVVTADFGMVKVPFLYASGPQKDVGGVNAAFLATYDVGIASVNQDAHILSVMPSIQISDAINVTPHVTWATLTQEDTDIYYLGVDADLKFDAVSAWGTFIYSGGQVDKINTGFATDSDVSGFLVAAGADAGIVHGQAFYATGDDVNSTSVDSDSFAKVAGSSYYWSEIMGLGVFDNTVSANSPGGQVTNIAAFNVGVTVKPMEKLKLDFDVWYAFLAEEISMPTATNPLNTEDELGIEFDAKITYALMDNLNAEFIFAYLVAGDATGPEDVMEGGARLSLSF